MTSTQTILIGNHQTAITFNRLKPKTMTLALLACWNLRKAEATLTTGAIVTADSIYKGTGTTDPYENCLEGLVDGKWPYTGFSKFSHCCAHNNASYNGAPSWFNINFGDRTKVMDVMIVSREDCCIERLIGTDLYVGDSHIAGNNTPCGANPTSTGVYSCGGKVGKYLGIYKNIKENLNISQIRAYSYAANAYTNY